MADLQEVSGEAAWSGLAMPPRPVKPLPTLEFFRTIASNSLSVCDEELFDELIVPRRYLWQRVFFVSDPDAIKRVFLDNMNLRLYGTSW